jgi:hypothetical protein
MGCSPAPGVEGPVRQSYEEVKICRLAKDTSVRRRINVSERRELVLLDIQKPLMYR